MIANMMMYARPELDAAHNRYWELVRKNLSSYGIDSPAALSQDAEEFSVWNDPTLVLSQTCGMPYRLWLHGKVQLAGTPDYGLENCPPGYYRSAIVVRASDNREQMSDFSDSVFAYNQTFSQSGYAAAWNHANAQGFWFKHLLHTEQHRKSALAVVQRHADIASLDPVTLRLLQRYEKLSTELKIIDWTEPTPGLPYITSAAMDSQLIHDAVGHAIEQLSKLDRHALGIVGLVDITADQYLAVNNPME